MASLAFLITTYLLKVVLKMLKMTKMLKVLKKYI